MTFMKTDQLQWESLDSHWKELIIKNIAVQENLHQLPDFSFWNGTDRNYDSLKLASTIDWEEIVSLPTKLDIYGSDVTSLNALNTTTNLQEFYMGDTAIADITPISNNEKLTKLCCYNSPIEQVDSLTKLSSLKRLCLSKTKVTDINPIGALLILEKLAVYKTDIDNIESLSKLTRLKKLNINFTKVTDISPLYELSALEELHCYGAPISDEQIIRFKAEHPNCIVIKDYEQPESQYDDFQ